MEQAHEHRFRRQPAGSLTLRQFVESLRRWTPEMRQVAQIALTRTDAERQRYLQGFHHGHAEREPGPMDSFVRWAYSDPRLDAVPALLTEIERPESEYAGAPLELFCALRNRRRAAVKPTSSAVRVTVEVLIQATASPIGPRLLRRAALSVKRVVASRMVGSRSASRASRSTKITASASAGSEPASCTSASATPRT